MKAKTTLCLCMLASCCFGGDLPHFPVDSVIHLEKNTNGNQVHYAVEVNEHCQPVHDSPLRPYWRMYEKGPEERARIMFWEQPGYGVRQPKSVQRADGGGHFEFTIRGVPERRIEMETFTLGSSCRARAYIEIDGQRAVFSKIAIVVSGWANVHRVEIFGSRVSDGSSVSEITHQDE